MTEYEAATLATRYAALALGALQCVILSYGLWRLHRLQTAFERKLDMAERRHAEAMKALDRGMKTSTESRADAMKASDERHAEAMKALDRGMKTSTESRADAMKTSTDNHAAAMKAGAERHAEAMKASAERHAEAMRALEALIERTAPGKKE